MQSSRRLRFQRILNAFAIPYRVLHDEDQNNPAAFAANARIAAATPAAGGVLVHVVGPDDLEGMLGCVATKGESKPFMAVRRLEELHGQGALPPGFIEATNVAYFGQTAESAAEWG